MNKLALHFIMKNESHVLERMLETSKDILNLIVCVDTGSTDNSISLLKEIGAKYNIPTYVFERPFDNFCNSRNFSMDKVKETAKELGWDLNKSYGFWYDCDEELIHDGKFDKNSLDKDLYMINAKIGSMNYTRNTFFRLSGNFSWYGPVHEFIIPKSPNITSGVIDGLHIHVNMDGGSWKEGNLHKKYRKHAEMLEDYINHEDRDPRWVFYTAQSYHDSASIPNNKEENEERLRRSKKYYTERVENPSGYPEERYYSQYRIGHLSKVLEEPWAKTKSELLKAYSMDPLRGESIKTIIDHYQQIGDWNISYLFSSFAYSTFNDKNPYPKRLLFVDSALYEWKFIETHATSCLYTGRLNESKELFKELLKVLESKPDSFTENDKQRIKLNSEHFLNLQQPEAIK